MKIILFIIDCVRAYRRGVMFESPKERSDRIQMWVLEYIFADEERQETMRLDWQQWDRAEFHEYRYWRRRYSVRR